MGLQSNLSNWEGEQETRRRNDQMKLFFCISFDTQRERRRWRLKLQLLVLLLLCFHCWSCWPNQLYTGTSVAAILLSLEGQLYVHLKLNIIPKLMLPVIIVRVVQIVYFYLGLFDLGVRVYGSCHTGQMAGWCLSQGIIVTIWQKLSIIHDSGFS